MPGLRHEGLRSRTAKLAAAADALKRQSGSTPPFSLAFLTDARRAPNPLAIARVLPRGAAVILRDYEAPRREGLAAQLKSICAVRGLKLLIGADIGLAQRVGADGVHLPSWAQIRRPIAPGMIVTAACHDAGEIARAAALRVNLAILSPIFATASHAVAPSLGAKKFLSLAASAPMPVLALGGVDEQNAPQLAGQNVAGIAAISAFFG